MGLTAALRLSALISSLAAKGPLELPQEVVAVVPVALLLYRASGYWARQNIPVILAVRVAVLLLSGHQLVRMAAVRADT